MIWVAHRRVLACHLKVAFVAARAHSAKGIRRKSMPSLVFQHCNVYRFSGISSKCHSLFFPLFDHDQKSDNINRCLIGHKQTVPKKIGAAAHQLAENVSFSHDISQVPHGYALLSDALQPLKHGEILSSVSLQSHCSCHANVKSLPLHNYKDVSL